MTAHSAHYLCPLCDEDAPIFLFYPALGLPICDECDAGLIDDEAVTAAACAIFDLTPALLSQIVEHQQPLRLLALEADRRFGPSP